jgi:ATP synthase protein I
MSDKQQKEKEQSEAQSGARNIGLGVTIPTTLAASVVVGCVIGLYLDKWLGTGPWMLLLFLVLGIAAGIRQMLLILRKMEDKEK